MNMEIPVIINLGCGRRKAPGEIGVDCYPGSNADILAEFSEGLPFADKVAEKVVCSHILEHVPDLVLLIEEIHRVLVPRGILFIEVPYFAHPDSFRDPTHRRFFTWGSFDYFVSGIRPAEYTKVVFSYRSRELIFSKSLWGIVGKLIFSLSPRRYEKYYSRIFPANALRIELQSV